MSRPRRARAHLPDGMGPLDYAVAVLQQEFPTCVLLGRAPSSLVGGDTVALLQLQGQTVDLLGLLREAQVLIEARGILVPAVLDALHAEARKEGHGSPPPSPGLVVP